MSDEAKAALQAQGAAKPVAAGAVAQIDPAAATASGIATGKALSDGVAVGIASGAVGVVEAATKMATAGAQAVKTQLKVQSPSRVMIDVGENVSEGFAIGMRGGIPDVQGAANDLSNIRIAPPANSNGGRESGGAQSERSSGPITVYVQIDGAGMSAQDITDEMVATTFERLRLAAGGG
jgi:hypothetical protein